MTYEIEKHTSTVLDGNNSYYIYITNEAIQDSIVFKPFIKTFSDNVNVKTTPTEVYGRMDAIQNYQNTTRNLSISFSLPAVDLDEAIINSINVRNLMRAQYPVYNDTTVGSNKYQAGIAAPPLCSIKFANFTSMNSDSQGKLFGYFQKVSFTPDYSAGTTMFFDDDGNIYPQLLEVSLEMTIIHTENLGWGMGQSKFKGNLGWRGTKEQNQIKKSSASNEQNEQANNEKIAG